MGKCGVSAGQAWVHSTLPLRSRDESDESIGVFSTGMDADERRWGTWATAWMRSPGPLATRARGPSGRAGGGGPGSGARKAPPSLGHPRLGPAALSEAHRFIPGIPFIGGRKRPFSKGSVSSSEVGDQGREPEAGGGPLRAESPICAICSCKRSPEIRDEPKLIFVVFSSFLKLTLRDHGIALPRLHQGPRVFPLAMPPEPGMRRAVNLR